MAGLQDNVNCKETEVAEMRNQIEELQYEYQKIQDRNYKLETHLAESRDKLKGLEALQIDDKVITKQETSTIAQSSLSLQKVYLDHIINYNKIKIIVSLLCKILMCTLWISFFFFFLNQCLFRSQVNIDIII